ncbi:TetR family transcriptional regulator [Nocardiopsis sp. HNM0947]|uniref:TetR family transcriptional regulator n=1 Tax=Nocardiopsis coralli TaxID=2772213 RepID=A0ABR9P0X9_9ACTN|nr:TetR/AcrR family transcriptional regulator [Nocardiopsis coralli]MBE2997463.1 TetR family transcriptional regulator [Nocardiopsis coralli]
MTADTSPDVLRTTGPVLDCAARLFAEHGPRSLTMSTLAHRIADETGADTDSLHRAFPTRLDLAHAVVLRSTRERVEGQLRADRTSEPAHERVCSLVRHHVHTSWKHRAAVELARDLMPALRAVSPGRYRQIAQMHRDYRLHVRDIISAGVGEGSFHVESVEAATRSVLDTCDSLEWYAPDDDLSLDGLTGVYIDLVLHHQLGHPR